MLPTRRYPNAWANLAVSSIEWTYDELSKLFAHFKMDLELGPKSRHYLMDAGFDDVRAESFMVTNLDGDPQALPISFKPGRILSPEKCLKSAATPPSS